MQVKFITGNSLTELEDGVNSFLDGLSDEPQEVRFDIDKLNVIIIYNKVRKNALCCECKFWQDTDGGTMGLCQRYGGRKRFDCKACANYEDVRDVR